MLERTARMTACALLTLSGWMHRVGPVLVLQYTVQLIGITSSQWLVLCYTRADHILGSWQTLFLVHLVLLRCVNISQIIIVFVSIGKIYRVWWSELNIFPYYLKGPFHDRLIPPFFSKKGWFLHQQKPLGTYCLCSKYFLQIHLIGEIITKLSIYYVDINIPSIVAYAIVQYSKTCVTHKCNLRIDWKFRNKLILSTSTGLS